MTAVWLRRWAVIPAAGGILAAVALAACGGSSGPGSYLGHASNGIVYVVWTNTGGGALTGTLYTAVTESDGSGGERLSTSNEAVTGKINGSNVSLSVNDGANLSATISSDRLVISNFPAAAPAGGVFTLPMQQTDTAGYNRALAAMRGKVTVANRLAQQRQLQQQASQQVQTDVAAVEGDLSTLTADIDGAGGDGSSLYTSALAQQSRDVATAHAEMEKVLGEAGSVASYNLCDDSYTVDDDVYTVNDDLYTVQDDQSTAADATSALSAAVSQLRQDDSVLEADRQSSYTLDVPPTPSASDVQRAIATGKAVQREINTASSNALASARSSLATAAGYGHQADAACTHADG